GRVDRRIKPRAAELGDEHIAPEREIGREQAVSLLRPLVLLRVGGWTAIVAPTRRLGDDRLLEIVRVPLEDLGRPAGGERAVAEQRARGTIGEEDPKLRMGPK